MLFLKRVRKIEKELNAILVFVSCTFISNLYNPFRDSEFGILCNSTEFPVIEKK